MTAFMAVEITEAQLLITGLLSGGGVIGLVVKWLVSSPERESAAYKAGVADEQERCAEAIKEIREESDVQKAELIKLRNGILHLALAADLTAKQRTDLAKTLGFDPIVMAASINPEGEKKNDSS